MEGTAKWVALILARYEFSCLVPPLWNTESDFLECRFQLHRDLFSCTTWLPRPLDDNLRTLPLEHLHATDLEVLSAALAGGQQLARSERTGHLRSAPRLWISPDDRRGFLWGGIFFPFFCHVSTEASTFLEHTVDHCRYCVKLISYNVEPELRIDMSFVFWGGCSHGQGGMMLDHKQFFVNLSVLLFG